MQDKWSCRSFVSFFNTKTSSSYWIVSWYSLPDSHFVTHSYSLLPLDFIGRYQSVTPWHLHPFQFHSNILQCHTFRMTRSIHTISLPASTVLSTRWTDRIFDSRILFDWSSSPKFFIARIMVCVSAMHCRYHSSTSLRKISYSNLVMSQTFQITHSESLSIGLLISGWSSLSIHYHCPNPPIVTMECCFYFPHKTLLSFYFPCRDIPSLHLLHVHLLLFKPDVQHLSFSATSALLAFELATPISPNFIVDLMILQFFPSQRNCWNNVKIIFPKNAHEYCRPFSQFSIMTDAFRLRLPLHDGCCFVWNSCHSFQKTGRAVVLCLPFLCNFALSQFAAIFPNSRLKTEPVHPIT